MVSLVHVFYILAIVLTWVVTCGYITSASVALHAIRKQDPDLKTAYVLTTTLAVLVWTAIALLLVVIVIGGVLGAVFGPEIAAAVSGLFGIETVLFTATGGTKAVAGAAKTGISAGTYVLLAAIVATMAGTGAVAFVARYYMSRADYDRTDDNFARAYKQLLIAGILSIISIGFPLVITLSLMVMRPSPTEVKVE